MSVQICIYLSLVFDVIYRYQRYIFCGQHYTMATFCKMTDLNISDCAVVRMIVCECELHSLCEGLQSTLSCQKHMGSLLCQSGDNTGLDLEHCQFHHFTSHHRKQNTEHNFVIHHVICITNVELLYHGGQLEKLRTRIMLF